MQKQRDIALDCLKAFAIFLVLWGHCIQYLSSTHYAEQPLYRIIYSFHMPLFMALVGYFATSLLCINSFAKVVWKKCRQLLIPAVVMIAFICLVQGYAVNGLIHFFKLIVINLWFLKVAFLCTVLFYVFAFNRKFRPAGIIISLIISQFIHLWYWPVNIMYPCFVLGYFLHSFRTYIECNSLKIMMISGCIFVAMLLFWDRSFWDMPEFTVNVASQSFTEFWGKTLYRLAIGIAGTIFFFSAFISLVDRLLSEKIKKRLQFVGVRTLGIYLVQSLLVEVILARTLNLDTLNPLVYNLVVTPAIALIALIICTLTVKLLEQTKITSALLLGKTGTA
ncbi:MAG: acyltransferase family protein [Muribaculaceae bacterium]|nr:acyltransferase family protein [Muribaculaceae bacterium]